MLREVDAQNRRDDDVIVEDGLWNNASIALSNCNQQFARRLHIVQEPVGDNKMVHFRRILFKNETCGDRQFCELTAGTTIYEGNRCYAAVNSLGLCGLDSWSDRSTAAGGGDSGLNRANHNWHTTNNLE